jgi:hypothetical protein
MNIELRNQTLDRMIERRATVPWVDHALRSESPDKWRLAFVELLYIAEQVVQEHEVSV